MQTKMVRLYGEKDLRLEEFELPEIAEDEILASVVTDSICMSTWKLAQQGENHKKSPNDLKANPVVVGHEFCGDILKVGEKWEGQYEEGQKYVVQANLQLPDRPDCPGYSYPYTGGDATYIILSKDVMETDSLLTYEGDTYFEGSLVEPLSTVIGAFKASYHTELGSYEHKIGIKEGGNLLIMGGTGPMGQLAIDFALNGPVNPKNLVVTGLTTDKVDRVRELYPSTSKTTVIVESVDDVDNQVEYLQELIQDKFDDIFIMVPNDQLVNDASNLLAHDGCVNFFAGPQSPDFEATINLYDIHYSSTHYVGTSGGNTDDMREAIELIESGKVNVEKIVTHILGLNDVADTTLNLPDIPGGKKLVYTHKNFPITALDTIDPISELGTIIHNTDGLWSKEAEEYIINTAEDI